MIPMADILTALPNERLTYVSGVVRSANHHLRIVHKGDRAATASQGPQGDDLSIMPQGGAEVIDPLDSIPGFNRIGTSIEASTHDPLSIGDSRTYDAKLRYLAVPPQATPV